MSCDDVVDEWVYLGKNLKLIYEDIYHWGGNEKFISNFKPALFAHLRILELIHPTSAFCWMI